MKRPPKFTTRPCVPTARQITSSLVGTLAFSLTITPLSRLEVTLNVSYTETCTPFSAFLLSQCVTISSSSLFGTRLKVFFMYDRSITFDADKVSSNGLIPAFRILVVLSKTPASQETFIELIPSASMLENASSLIRNVFPSIEEIQSSFATYTLVASYTSQLMLSPYFYFAFYVAFKNAT